METVTYFTFIHEPGSKGEKLFPQVPSHVNKRHINLGCDYSQNIP